MAKDYTRGPPNFRPLVFWCALLRQEHKEKPDKSFTTLEEFARLDNHWRLKLSHSACPQALRARAGNHLSRKTTRFSYYAERYHRTHKAGYPSGRLKDLAERSAIIGTTKTAVMSYEEAKTGEGGPN
jgi:hypothetical protein